MKTRLLMALTCLSLIACGEDSTKPPFDIAGLTAARTAVPDSDTVMASSPGDVSMTQRRAQALIGERALYPTWSRGLVLGVNRTVGDVIRTLEFVVSLEPTGYDPETQEYWWGPYPNEDAGGHIAAYIRKEADGADFAYEYAFVRGDGPELANREVVLFGGSNPDPDDRRFGSGVLLWDFTANHRFDVERGAEADGPGGRFAALYHRERDPIDASRESRVVYAVFRNFTTGEDESEPVDLDYFYGDFHDDEHRLRFLNYRGAFDVYDGDDDPDTNEPTQNEMNDVRLVFLDAGMGRAEATATGGDLEDQPLADSVVLRECWDDRILETYLAQIALDESGEEVWSHEMGSVDDCGGPFRRALRELSIPAIDDVDEELRGALDEVARDGAPARERDR